MALRSLGRYEEQNSLLFVLLIVALVWLPVPLGSNRPWSLGLMCALTTGLLGLWSLGHALRPRQLAPALGMMKWPLLLLGLWALTAVIQLLPLPAQWVTSLGGRAHQNYLIVSRLFPMETASLSLDRDATLSGLLFASSSIAIFILVLALVTSRRRLTIFLKSLFAIGFAQAVYGILVVIGADSATVGKVTGTYANQNHFSGLMELTIAAGLALYLAQPREAIPFSSPREFARSLIAYLMDGRGILAFGMIVMCGALLMSTSRGAFLSLCAGIALTSALTLLTRGINARELRAGIVLIVVLAGAAAWFGASGLSEKLTTTGLHSNRAELRDLGYRMVEDHALTGTGLGTFRWVFPAYKDHRFGSGFYEHVHNDFMETAVEQGIGGALALVSALSVVLAHLILALKRTPDALVRAAIFGGLTGTFSILIHGLVDFNLHIPANAGMFFALLGAACCASSLGREGARIPVPSAGAAVLVPEIRGNARPMSGASS